MILKESTDLKITNSAEVANLLHGLLRMEDEIDRDKEHFWVIGLNIKNIVQFVDLVSLGSLHKAVVEPREVFRLAVIKGVASIIVGHNHPSGEPEPSENDIALTKKLKQAGDILEIPLLDHVIIGDTKHVSLAKKGVI